MSLINFDSQSLFMSELFSFDSETHKLSEEQTTWVSEAIEQVYKLLEDTPPDGASFAKSIRHILKVLEMNSFDCLK